MRVLDIAVSGHSRALTFKKRRRDWHAEGWWFAADFTARRRFHDRTTFDTSQYY